MKHAYLHRFMSYSAAATSAVKVRCELADLSSGTAQTHRQTLAVPLLAAVSATMMLTFQTYRQKCMKEQSPGTF